MIMAEGHANWQCKDVAMATAQLQALLRLKENLTNQTGLLACKCVFWSMCMAMCVSIWIFSLPRRLSCSNLHICAITLITLGLGDIAPLTIETRVGEIGSNLTEAVITAGWRCPVERTRWIPDPVWRSTSDITSRTVVAHV